MSKTIDIHPVDPQPSRLNAVCQVLDRSDGVIVYPAETGFMLGCCAHSPRALARIARIRALTDDHPFTMVCRGLSEMSQYAHIDNAVFRWLKAQPAGLFTFLLPAKRTVPKHLMRHKQQRVIGLRLANHPVVQALLALRNYPLVSSTLPQPDEVSMVTALADIAPALSRQVDMMIDCPPARFAQTTVVDLTDATPRILRHGAGELQGD